MSTEGKDNFGACTPSTVRIQDAEGVTSQLDSYIDVGEGSLDHRKHDVEQLFRKRVTGDLSLALCPAPGKVDPDLWEVMMCSLLTPLKGATAARAQTAGRLVEEIREMTRLHDQRIRSRRSREPKKQVCSASVCETNDESAVYLPLCVREGVETISGQQKCALARGVTSLSTRQLTQTPHLICIATQRMAAAHWTAPTTVAKLEQENERLQRQH